MTKTILVTGGTRGLGLQLAARLKRSGYRVVVTGRKMTPALQLLLDEADSLGSVHYHHLDFAELSSIHPAVSAITEKYGSLYGLVNNAACGLDGILATMHESEIIKVMQTNLTATIILTKYALRTMLINQTGRVINISSIIAATGFSGLSVYAASKAGLDGFTRSLAREVGKAGITVNTVAPGYMQTDMTSSLVGERLETIRRRSPLGRLVAPSDVSEAVLFLLGEEAASITGTRITIDAGSTA